MTKKLNRREFLRISAVSAGAAALAAACGGPAPAAPQAPAEKATEAPKAEEKPTEAPKAEAQATAAPTAMVSKAGCQIDWNPTYPPTPKKYDPPVEVSIVSSLNPASLPKGMTWEQTPAYQEVLQNTGVKYTVAFEEGGQYDQKIAAALAANTLPDMFHTSGIFLEQLIEADAIADIKSVWEATASPLVKQKKGYPDYKWWKPAIRGDKVWGIPFVYGPAYNVDNICFARQDLLDKVGLKAPETVDDWTKTAKALKDAKLTTFGINACKNLVTWYQSLDPIFGAFGVMPTAWVKGADGKLVYGSIAPDVKKALALINTWYKDGLMDPDFYTYGEGDAAANIAGSKVGLWSAPWWTGGGDIQLERDHPGMQLRPIPYPKGPDGKQGRIGSGEVGNVIVFRKGINPAALEASINNLNWHMEKHVNWEKYQQYGEWRNNHVFQENIEWIFDDNCELIPGPITKADSYQWMAYVDFGFIYGGYPEYQAEMFQAINEWQKKDPQSLNKAQRYILNKSVAPRESMYYTQVFDTRNVAIMNEYWGNPTKEMQKVQPDLATLESQTFIDIVVGNKPLDAFDEFVKTWKSSGGDQVTKDVNDWYAATYKS